MKYELITWPEVQDYMIRSDFNDEMYFDPKKDVWFIPENWVK